jgi:hypothetical protein
MKFLRSIARFVSRTTSSVVCRFSGHVLDEPTKKCSRCRVSAPMCEWCGEHLARAVAMIGDKKQIVCLRCGALP